MRAGIQSLLILLGILGLSVEEPINLIFLIPDGFGPASETLTRLLYNKEKGKNLDTMVELPLDSILVGKVETYPLNIGHLVRDPKAEFGAPVTDSAAGATAYSCGIKTYNGAVAVDGEGKPRATILEAAKLKGMRTGIVVTSTVSHATPGSFWGHAIHRNMESLISEYMVGMHGIKKMNDVLLGGGLCSFIPGGSVSIQNRSCPVDSCRNDAKNLIEYAKSIHNAAVVTEFSALKSINLSERRPIMGLFAQSHMAYEIDRSLTTEPSLAEMANVALEILSPINADEEEEGFMLLIEGSKIDIAAHANDIAAHYHEILAFQEAVKVSISYANAHPNTLVIVLSDHETGGISIGHQISPNIYPDYVWYPDEILKVRRSLTFMVEKSTLFLNQLIKAFPPTSHHPRFSSDEDYQKQLPLHNELIRDFIKRVIIRDCLGLQFNDSRLADGVFMQSLVDNIGNMKNFENLISQFICQNSLVSWSTHGHTGVDVDLYAYGYASSLLRGFHSNNEIGVFIANLFDLNLDHVTRLIRDSIVIEGNSLFKAIKSKKVQMDFLDMVDDHGM